MSVPLLRAEGGEEAAQVGLEATEDGCAPIIEAAILPLSPDKSFVVDVARGLNGSDVIKQACGILVKTASRVGDHREKGDVKVLDFRLIFSAFALFDI